MKLELVKKIADAVLYEGYMLYPYRASSVKNRQRFNWGALAPESYSTANNGTEAFAMQTECLVMGVETASLEIKIRFLQLVNREIGEISSLLAELPEDFKDFRLVPVLETGGKLFQVWQEAIEREIDFPIVNLSETKKREIDFSFPAKCEIEPLRDENKMISGVMIRTQEEINGKIQLLIESLNADAREGQKLFKVTVRIENQTPFEMAGAKTRDEALLHSTVSTHTIMGAKNGEFISLLDPPDKFRGLAANCKNIGTYPVLAGDENEKDCMLSSPIILYDYPQIAGESAGDLFDGTEIDEILTLRIMTLTDEEKREMRSIDDRARKILERTENMPQEQLMKMHGALRSLRPVEKNTLEKDF